MNDILTNTLTLENRKSLKISGVKKIISLNPLEFQLDSFRNSYY